MTTYARAERAALCDLLDEVGPDAPTLCTGWDARDLAAHLVVREARPDTLPGLVVAPLAGWTRRVQQAAAERPYPELVAAVRSGPPRLSVYALPGADSAGNLVEYFVHHEDVRRAQAGWQPRPIDPALADELWGRVRRLGRLFFRRVPVGLVLRRTDGAGGELRVRGGEPAVVLSGPAPELLLRMYGRTRARVEVSGDPAAVARFEAAPLGV